MQRNQSFNELSSQEDITLPIIWKPSFFQSKEDLENLFQNKVSGLVVGNFLSQEQCDRFSQIVAPKLHPYDYQFKDDVPEAQSLFDTHYLYETRPIQDYLSAAPESISQYRALVEELGFDPFEMVRQTLQNTFGTSVTIAQQDGQDYTHAIVRELSSSALLHADFAQFIPKHWSISDIEAELAWNIYITDPGKGGECVVYNKPWEVEDDSYIIGETYGYDQKVVEDKEYSELNAEPGKLILFNSRNFHKVNKSEKLRLSIGGHIGLKPDGSLVMWV